MTSWSVYSEQPGATQLLQNIDPVYLVQPAVVIAICVVLLLYWHRRRRFRLSVFGFSLLAYAAAIGLKYEVQIPTIDSVRAYFGSERVGLGVYYGLQTVFFEVGLAYLVARWAIKRGGMNRNDAEGYGAGLAFWENGVLLGALSLVNLVSYLAILSSPTPLAQIVYDQLSARASYLFNPTPLAFASVAAGTVERFASILVHFAWGYLCVMAVALNRRSLFLIALPMGLVDSLVPFAGPLGIPLFESAVLALSIISISVAFFSVRRAARAAPTPSA